MEHISISSLLGKTITSIYVHGNKEIFIKTKDNCLYRMYYEQDGGECVELEDVCDDLKDLIDEPLVLAEEETDTGINLSYRDKLLFEDEDVLPTYTWTFYKLATIKGTVVFRWYGCSEGYYSESVDLVRLSDKFKEKVNEGFIKISLKNLESIFKTNKNIISVYLELEHGCVINDILDYNDLTHMFIILKDLSDSEVEKTITYLEREIESRYILLKDVLITYLNERESNEWLPLFSSYFKLI